MSLPVVKWPGPVVLSVAMLILAVVAYLLHRWRVFAGLASALGCLFLGQVVLGTVGDQAPPLWGYWEGLDRPLVLLGREWVFTYPDRVVAAFVLIAAGFAFLLSLPAEQGWGFYHFGVSTVAFLLLAIAARQSLYALLFLWLAANMAVMVLAGGRRGETSGALRFLVLTSVAMMPLLVLPHFAAEVPGTAAWLVLIGFSILMMLIPFHGQLIAIAARTAPMVPTWMFLTFSPTAFYVLLKLLDAYPELVADHFLFDLCRWTGRVAVVVGGMAAVGQRRWGYLVGYATLVNWGAGLVAFGQGTEAGVSVALQMWGWRALSLLLVGAGLTVVRGAIGEDDAMSSCGGLLRRRPVGVMALTIGILSLGMAPPAGVGPRVAWPMALGAAGVGLGVLAGLKACLGNEGEGWRRERGAVAGVAFATLALWVAVALASRAGTWMPLAARIVHGLSFLGTNTAG